MARTILTIGLAAGLCAAASCGALAAEPTGSGKQYQKTNEYRQQHQGSTGANQYQEQYQERERHEEAVQSKEQKQQTKGTRQKSRTKSRSKTHSGS